MLQNPKKEQTSLTLVGVGQFFYPLYFYRVHVYHPLFKDYPQGNRCGRHGTRLFLV